MGKRKPLPIEELLSECKVLGATPDLGIPELSHIEVTGPTGLRIANDQLATAMLDSSAVLAEQIAALLLGDNWKLALPRVVDLMRQKMTGKKNRDIERLELSTDAATLSELLHVHDVLQLVDDTRAAIAEDNAPRAAHCGVRLGDSMCKLVMHRHQRSTAIGNKCLPGKPKGVNKKDDEVRREQATKYLRMVEAEFKERSHIGWRDALKRVAAKLPRGHGERTISNYLRDSLGITSATFGK